MISTYTFNVIQLNELLLQKSTLKVDEKSNDQEPIQSNSTSPDTVRERNTNDQDGIK